LRNPLRNYGDSLRISLLYEHIETIEKSMNKLNELSAAEDEDYHMIVRWVINKEEHAKELQYIVSQYFLHQRIVIKDIADTEAYNKYIEQLTLMHKLLVYAMKSNKPLT
jgi:nickel superoxide dismutase